MTSPLIGKRVRLIRCNDRYTKLPPGIAVHVVWDNGSRLGLCADDGDQFEVIRMSFADFRATGKDFDGIVPHYREEPARGRMYLDSLIIEKKPLTGWPNGRPEEWSLLLGNNDWLTDDLEELERRLFAFAVAEGYCDL
jgi:hypothetical protein